LPSEPSMYSAKSAGKIFFFARSPDAPTTTNVRPVPFLVTSAAAGMSISCSVKSEPAGAPSVRPEFRWRGGCGAWLRRRAVLLDCVRWSSDDTVSNWERCGRARKHQPLGNPTTPRHPVAPEAAGTQSGRAYGGCIAIKGRTARAAPTAPTPHGGGGVGVRTHRSPRRAPWSRTGRCSLSCAGCGRCRCAEPPLPARAVPSLPGSHAFARGPVPAPPCGWWRHTRCPPSPVPLSYCASPWLCRSLLHRRRVK
jgi:hypothetical protein